MDIFKEVSDSAARSLSRTLNDSIAFEKAKKKGEAKELNQIVLENKIPICFHATCLDVGDQINLTIISMHEIDGQKYIVTEIGLITLNV